MIFKGQVNQITSLKGVFYAPDINFVFQEKAWVNSSVANTFVVIEVPRIIINLCGNVDENYENTFDNLGAQKNC